MLCQVTFVFPIPGHYSQIFKADGVRSDIGHKDGSHLALLLPDGSDLSNYMNRLIMFVA